MHVVRVKKVEKGATYESILLRQSYREGAKVRKRTLASLTALPAPVIDAVERMFGGEVLVPAHEALTNTRSLPDGHVLAVLGTTRKLGLDDHTDPRSSRERDLVLAMVAVRVLEPASKLATTRLFSSTSLGPTLGVEGATDDELYAAMD